MVDVACGEKTYGPGGPYVCQTERHHVDHHRYEDAQVLVVWNDTRTIIERKKPPSCIASADLDALTARVAALEAARPAVDEPLESEEACLLRWAAKRPPTGVHVHGWTTEEPSVSEVQFRRTADMLRRQVDQLQSELVELERQRDAARATVEVAGALVRRQNEQHERERAADRERIRALEGSAAERCRAEAELRRVRPVVEAVLEWMKPASACHGYPFDDKLYAIASACFDDGGEVVRALP